jgi:hypothetical protein
LLVFGGYVENAKDELSTSSWLLSLDNGETEEKAVGLTDKVLFNGFPAVPNAENSGVCLVAFPEVFYYDFETGAWLVRKISTSKILSKFERDRLNILLGLDSEDDSDAESSIEGTGENRAII